MILKIKRESENGDYAWEFIDEISNPTVEVGKLGVASLFIEYYFQGTRTRLLIDSEAYLLNNEGKTVERIN